MPTKRRLITPQRRTRAGELTREKVLYLFSGFNLLDGQRAFEGATRDEIRRHWEKHRGPLLREYIDTYPCSRPWAWWEFDAPTRRLVKHSPDFLVPMKEPEYAYLKRRKFLEPNEEAGAWAQKYMPVLLQELEYWERARKQLAPRVAGELVWKARRRNAADHENGHARGLWFDEEAADKFLAFCFLLCRHSKGKWARKPVRLSPWQMYDIVRPIFGWMRMPDGMTAAHAARIPSEQRRDAEIFRRFAEAYLEIARKNGKSTMLAVFGLFLLMADNEPGAEVYCAATRRKQAKIVHGESVKMREKSPDLRALTVFRATDSSIEQPATESVYLPLGADSEGIDGLNSHGVIIDEFHLHKTPDVYEALTTGDGARDQPLTIEITTAGRDRETVCWTTREYVVLVLDGKREVDGETVGMVDDTRFGYICTLDDEKEWEDPAMWIKANPNLGLSITTKALQDKVNAAMHSPAERLKILRRRFNLWLEGDSPGIDMTQWDACSIAKQPRQWRLEMLEVLKRAKCSAAIDIASTSDFTAIVLLFVFGGKVVCLPWFWLPGQSSLRKDKQMWPHIMNWKTDGFLEFTEGNVTDYSVMRDKVLELSRTYDFGRKKTIRVDHKFQGSTLCGWLIDEGFDVIGFSQSPVAMTAPTKQYLDWIKDGKLEHGNNPVLRWMASNTALRDSKDDLIKFVRKSLIGKIDGIVGGVMAAPGIMIEANKPSRYETQGLRSI